MKNASSLYTGVYLHTQTKKWIARIKIKGKTKHIGCFHSGVEASKAYQKELNNLNNLNG